MKFTCYAIVLLLFVSCSSSDRIHVVSDSFHENDVWVGNWPGIAESVNELNDSLGVESISATNSLLPLNQWLTDSIKTESDLKKIIAGWEEMKVFVEKSRPAGFLPSDKELVTKWFAVNLKVLKITGETTFANEIENLLHTPGAGILIGKELLEQFVFTKMNDQIYVNLFIESSAHYEHTTGGAVHITQETNYPKEDHVKIRFESGDKRFVELFIRIPSNIQRASVIVGGVKYKAVPGEYCRVAKQWKTGDVVEISFM